jgi:hypothetical protein
MTGRWNGLWTFTWTTRRKKGPLVEVQTHLTSQQVSSGQHWQQRSTAAVHAACCHLQLLQCAVHAYCMSLF